MINLRTNIKKQKHLDTYFKHPSLFLSTMGRHHRRHDNIRRNAIRCFSTSRMGLFTVQHRISGSSFEIVRRTTKRGTTAILRNLHVTSRGRHFVQQCIRDIEKDLDRQLNVPLRLDQVHSGLDLLASLVELV